MGIKSIDYNIRNNFSPDGLDALKKIGDKEKKIDYRYLRMKPSTKNDFDFRMFLPLKLFFNSIYFGDVLIPAVEREQDVFEKILENFKKYKPKTDSNVDDKNKTLTSAQNLYDGREMIINAFKKKLFPLLSGNYYEEFEEEELSESEGEDEIPNIGTSEQITELDEFYGPDLINKYFIEETLTKIINKLKDYKKNPEKKYPENNISNMPKNDVKNKK